MIKNTLEFFLIIDEVIFILSCGYIMTDLGYFGVPAFLNHVGTLMFFASGLSVLCELLFIVGLAGWTTDQKSIQSVSWTSVNVNLSPITSIEYFGLQGLYTSLTVSGASSSAFTLYSDCTGTLTTSLTDDAAANLCPSCMSAGKSAFGLTLITFFLTGLVGVCGLVRGCFGNTGVVKILAMIGNIFAMLFSIAAFAVWRSKCYSLIQKEITNHVPSSATTTLATGAGFNAVIAGFVFLIIIFLIHTLTPSTPKTEDIPVATLHQVYTPSSDERGNASFSGSTGKEANL